MKRLIPTLAAAALACAATIAVAQGGPGYGPGAGPGGGYGPGSGTQGQGRGVHREQMRAAFEACKDKPDRRACMTEQFCAKSEDPAKCQAMSKQRQETMSKRADARQAAAEACTGKRGDELQQCYRDQRQKRGGAGAGRPAQK